MAPLAQAWVAVRPDTKGFANETATQTSKAFGGLTGHFTSLGKTAGLALASGAVAGVAGLAVVFKTGFSEVSDYQKGLAQANAVIKSTGGAAGVTSKHVEDLASTIQHYSGQTDDSIVAGENLLLTFTNIRNSTGKNNDIFDQSTKILADMSQALGEDAPTAAIQLGKALNDPVKGVTALQRVGVSFTQQQRDQIKAMVDSGDTMGAQKVILGELNKEFGGSAAAYGKTMPGAIDIAKRSFEDFSQNVVTAVLPPLVSLAQKILPVLGRAFGTVSHVIGDFFHGFTVGIDGINDPQTKAAQIGAQLYSVWADDIMPALNAVIPVVKEVASTIADDLGKAMSVLLPVITQHVIPAFVGIVNVIKTDVLPIVKQIVGFIVDKLVPAFAKVLGAALDAAKKAFEKIGKALHDHQAQINEVLHAVEKLASFLLKILVPVLEVAVKTAFRIISTVIVTAIDVVSALVGAFNWLAGVAKSVWHAISGVVSAQIAVVKSVIHAGMGVVSALVGAFNTVRDTAKSVWRAVSGAVATAVHAIGGSVHTLIGFFEGIPGDIARAFSSLANLIKQPFIDAFNGVISAYNNTIGRIPGVSDIKPVTVSLNGVLSNSGGLGAFSTPSASPTGGGSTIRKMAEGGLVRATPGGILANIGEAGHDERVTPLDAGGMTSGERQIIALLQQLLQVTAVVGPANFAANLNSTARASAHAARGITPVFG